MTDPTPRVRIAPSPTGDPHVGTAYMALFNLAFARKHQGTFTADGIKDVISEAQKHKPTFEKQSISLAIAEPKNAATPPAATGTRTASPAATTTTRTPPTTTTTASRGGRGPFNRNLRGGIAVSHITERHRDILGKRMYDPEYSQLFRRIGIRGDIQRLDELFQASVRVR